jgi:hypothetical protein
MIMRAALVAILMKIFRSKASRQKLNQLLPPHGKPLQSSRAASVAVSGK